MHPELRLACFLISSYAYVAKDQNLVSLRVGDSVSEAAVWLSAFNPGGRPRALLDNLKAHQALGEQLKASAPRAAWGGLDGHLELAWWAPALNWAELDELAAIHQQAASLVVSHGQLRLRLYDVDLCVAAGSLLGADDPRLILAAR